VPYRYAPALKEEMVLKEEIERQLQETLSNGIRPCSFVSDWWVGTIPDRIASLIYINFD
jgi:hypothetical protein